MATSQEVNPLVEKALEPCAMAKPAEYEDMDETTYILDGRASKPAKKEWPILPFVAGERGPASPPIQ